MDLTTIIGNTAQGIEHLSGWIIAIFGGLTTLTLAYLLYMSITQWKKMKVIIRFEKDTRERLERVEQGILWLKTHTPRK